jgi:hypothetical protein
MEPHRAPAFCIHHTEPASHRTGITQNWRGKPLVSHEVIVKLIGATTTTSGLHVQCHLDENSYPKAIRVSDAQMSAINIDRDPFHGEWNYTISPNLSRPMAVMENGSGNDRQE